MPAIRFLSRLVAIALFSGLVLGFSPAAAGPVRSTVGQAVDRYGNCLTVKRSTDGLVVVSLAEPDSEVDSTIVLTFEESDRLVRILQTANRKKESAPRGETTSFGTVESLNSCAMVLVSDEQELVLDLIEGRLHRVLFLDGPVYTRTIKLLRGR